MGIAFRTRQGAVNSSELEGLTNLPSHVVADIASICGWNGLYGQRLSVDIGVALNVLILSIFRTHLIELPGMRQWLPGLRTEALLILARDHANWRYDGPDAVRDFFPALSGPDSQVRGKLANLLGVNLPDARALLRFHSQNDVEFLTSEQLERGHSGRPVLFSIYATNLAGRLQALTDKPLFFCSPKPAD